MTRKRYGEGVCLRGRVCCASGCAEVSSSFCDSGLSFRILSCTTRASLGSAVSRKPLPPLQAFLVWVACVVRFRSSFLFFSSSVVAACHVNSVLRCTWVVIGSQEAPEMNAVLYLLLLQLPQACYFDIRTAYMERREQQAQQQSSSSSVSASSTNSLRPPTSPSSSAATSTSSTTGTVSQGSPLAYLSRLMSLFRTSFTPQCVALEHLAEEFVTQAKPSAIDEVLCAVRTLFQQCVEIGHAHTRLPPVAAHFLRVNILARYRAR